MGADFRAAANDWIRDAEDNLAHAGAGLASNPGVECYYAQQAAEMAVKAVFVSRGIPHLHIHDIAALLGALERMGMSIPDEVDDAGDLTEYAVKTRYAGVEHKRKTISQAERREAVRLARIVLEWAKAEISK